MCDVMLDDDVLMMLLVMLGCFDVVEMCGV